MQFTTLFSIAASAVLAKAHVLVDGEQMGTDEGQDAIVFNAYREYTDSCPTANATTTFGGVATDVGECQVFDQSFASVELLGRENGYDVNFFLTDDCSSTDGNLLVPNLEQCYPGNDGDVNEPWLSWKVVTA